MEYKADRRPIRENDLVSEQPGFFILFLGFIFALAVGFSIRTAAQSDWFHIKLKEAIDNVGKEWRIEYGEVGLYFKDGLRPTIGIFADGVKIASASRCLMKSGGFAQKVKIPLSLINYIVDGQLVSEIEIENFKIEITEKKPVCNTSDVPADIKSETPEKKKKNQISIVDRVERSQLKNEIQKVRINRLEIYYPHEKFDYFVMKNIVVTNKSTHPKIIYLEGNLDLNPILKTAEGQATASLKIEYNEFPEKIIKSNLLGSLREGFFSLQLVNRLDDEKFQIQSELKNVSLSLLKGFLYEIPKNLNLKSNWLSLKFYSEGSLRSLGASQAQWKDLLVNGDLGEITVDELNFPNGFQKPWEPFEIKLHGIDLSKIAELVPSIEMPKQIESLGSLSGKLKLTSDAAISAVGQLSGVEVVFSANGVRKTEKLNIENITGNWSKNKLEIGSHELRIDNRMTSGFFNFKSNELKTFYFETQFKNLELSSSVSELVTGTEQPVLFDDLSLKVTGGKKVIHYKANGKIKSLSHKYAEVKGMAFTVQGSAGETQDIEVKAEQVQYTSDLVSVLTRFDIEIPTENNKAKVKVKVSKLDSQIQLRFETGSGVKILAMLENENDVNGVISTKNKEWKIYGTRDAIKVDKK